MTKNLFPCSMLPAPCSVLYSRRAAGRENLPHRFPGSSTASGSAVLLEAFRQELASLDGLKERISPSSTDLPSKE